MNNAYINTLVPGQHFTRRGTECVVVSRRSMDGVTAVTYYIANDEYRVKSVFHAPGLTTVTV